MYDDTYGTLLSSLAQINEKKIVLLVMDGVGDCDNDGKGTALQIANTPNLDALANSSGLGQHIPVAPAVTPGSGPGHLGLFGYDPLVYQVGRGVLSALGVEFGLTKRDVAARLNFCTLDGDGNVVDRRAGRIPDEVNKRVLQKIRDNLTVPAGVELFWETEAEHRAVLVLRGDDLDDNIGDTDPQKTGVPPLRPDRAPHDKSRTALLVADIFDQVKGILADEEQANMVLGRGFAKAPDWPTFEQRWKLKPAAVAGYPMYRGVARLVEMDLVAGPTTAADVCSEIAKVLAGNEKTFVFGHFKYTDKTGEDGDLDAKVQRIEEMDTALPVLLDAKPDVLIITGDHSTPPSMKSHSWHPVPFLMHAPRLRGGDGMPFDEVHCRSGQFGTILARELIPMAMAHADKLEKFGA
jgi:2,3-bisphosphoglycerate-independent phosphoglycerate mutase